MTDLTNLGFDVDTAGLKAGEIGIDRVTNASNKLASSLGNVATQGQKAQSGTATYVAQLNKATAQTNQLQVMNVQSTGTGEKHKASIEGQGKALRALAQNLSLLSPLVGSTTGQIAMLYIGNSRLFNSWNDLKTGVMSFITPLRLLGLTAGIVAVAGVALAKAWKDDALAVDELARRSGMARSSMRGLMDMASERGINTDEFASSMQKFSEQVYKARNGMGELYEVFRANGGQAKSFNEYLARAADLIKNATSEEQKYTLLRQMGLPATAQWVRYLSQGGDAIRRGSVALTEADAKEASLIKKAKEFDDAWNKAWTSFSRGFKSAFMDIASWKPPEWFSMMLKVAAGAVNPGLGMGVILDALKQFGNNITTYDPKTRVTIYGGLKPSYQGVDESGYADWDKKGSASSKTVDYERLQREIQLYQAKLGLLGNIATIEQQMKGLELQISESKVKLTDDELKKLREVTRERLLGIDAIKAQTDSMKIEAATFGMSVGQATAYRLEQERLNQAIRDRQTLSEQDRAAIRASAQAAGEAAQQLANMREASQMLGGAMIDFKNTLIQTGDFMKALGAAASNVLNKIADKLITMAVDKLVMNAFGGAGGGFFNAIFKMFGFASGGVFSRGQAQAFASGGVVNRPTLFPMANGMGLMGEAGPEAVMPLKRINGRLGVEAAGGGQPIVVQIGGTTINVEGNADEKTLKEMDKRLAKRDAEFSGRVVKVMREAKSRRVQGV